MYWVVEAVDDACREDKEGGGVGLVGYVVKMNRFWKSTCCCQLAETVVLLLLERRSRRDGWFKWSDAGCDTVAGTEVEKELFALMLTTSFCKKLLWGGRL